MKIMKTIAAKDIRKLYPEPRDLPRNAHAPCLEETTERFLRASTLLLLSSTNSDGYIDTTPRGGASGFIKIVDNRNIAFLNEMGNNKQHTLFNLAKNMQVGMMFLVSGMADVVRAYGNAISTSDEEFIESIGGNLKRNKTAVKIEIIKVFPHCSTALNLAGLWREDKWPDKNALNIPSVNEMAESLAIHRLKLENNNKE
jgi:predicted pyridoxine 5'-phosphate oxidase superfamily flavin-nucleotide-binding protein